MAIDLFKLQGLVTLSGIELAAKQVRELEKGAYKLMKPITEIGRRAERTGIMLTKRLTVPLGLLGGAAVKFAGDFEKAMTTSTAIMSGVTAELNQQMRDTAKQLSTESTFSAKELAESYYYLASAGLSVEESISQISKVTKFAEAGQFDMKRATELLTDAQSALGLSIGTTAEKEENLIRVSDVLVKANTLANASVEQFAESLTNKAAASLRVVGKDVEEGVAVLAAFADQGTKGEEAGTQFAIVLRDLQKAALKNKAEFKAQNIAVFDAQENFRNMADVIGDVENALEGKSDADKKATLSALGFQERSIQSLLTLIGTSEKIREYEIALRGAAGTTEEVAEKQLQNFNDQMKIMFNRLKIAAIELGDELLPIIKNELFPIVQGLVKMLINLVRAFKDLPTPVKGLTIAFTGLIAIIGPAQFAFGKLLLSISSMPGILTTAKTAINAFTLALSTNPYLAAATAIGVLIAGIISLTAAYQGADEAFDQHRKKVKEDIEAKQMGRKEELLGRLILKYKELNDAATLGAPGDLYYSIKQDVDYLEKSLADIGDLSEEFTGGYIKRLQDAKEALFYLKSERIEDLEIRAGAGEMSKEEEKDLEAYTKQLKKEISALKEHDKELQATLELRDEIDKNVEAENEQMKKDSIAFDKAREANAKKYRIFNETEKEEKIRLNKEALDEALKDVEKGLADELVVRDYYKKKEQEINDKYDEIEKEKEKKKKEEKHDLYFQTAQMGLNTLQMFYDNEAIAIDNNYKRRQKAIENSQRSEEEKKKALETLDAEFDDKRAKLQKKQAIAQKAMSLFNIYNSTREAIMKAWAIGGPIGGILSGFIGALGALQAALVASQPIPQMAEGGIIPKSQGGTLVRAAEAGEDEGFIPMRTGTASIAQAIINSMRRFPFAGQGESPVGGGGIGAGAVNLNIGTLIADDRGLTELERRMKVVRVAENNRLGIA